MAAERARSRLARTLVLAALAGLAGCSRPDWTNPETSKGSRALPPPKVTSRPTDPGPAPPPPGWIAPLLGKALRDVFPRDGVCVGNTDGVALVFQGQPSGARLAGWAWEYGAKAPVPRVVVVDAQDRIVGGGVTGVRRLDVPRAMPAITSDTTGWEAIVVAAPGPVRTFGVVEGGQAVCPLAGAML